MNLFHHDHAFKVWQDLTSLHKCTTAQAWQGTQTAFVRLSLTLCQVCEIVTVSSSFMMEIDQEFNPKRGLEIKSGGTECYKLSTISMLF